MTRYNIFLPLLLPSLVSYFPIHLVCVITIIAPCRFKDHNLKWKSTTTHRIKKILHQSQSTTTTQVVRAVQPTQLQLDPTAKFLEI